MKKEILDSFERKYCPVMKSVAQIGDKWVLLILRECFLGFKKFEEFQENLKVSRSVLANKLKLMVELDLLEKHSYQNNSERKRYDYHLSKKGRGLLKVIVSLVEWGNEFIVSEEDPTIVTVERRTDNRIHLELRDKSDAKVEWSNVKMQRIG